LQQLQLSPHGNFWQKRAKQTAVSILPEAFSAETSIIYQLRMEGNQGFSNTGNQDDSMFASALIFI
jgi:hypothetical protein